MRYLTNIVGKDLLRTVYTVAMTNQVEQDHYLINPQRKIFQIMNTYIEEGIQHGEFRQDVSLCYHTNTYSALYACECL